jgi:GntR family transcriptional regulator, transcriptional repressor for pyruvate dehydrogenase complex
MMRAVGSVETKRGAVARADSRHRKGARSEHPFRPIMASKASLEVADQLTYAIASGWYQAGDRLPIIPDIAKAMNVSPPVIGEAIRLLSDAGVVEVRRGQQGGITVLSGDIPPEVIKLSRPRLASSLRAIVEARRPVEIAIVRLAAARATDAHFEELERTNARLVLARGNPRPWTEAHNAFHYTMGRAAGNEVLAHFQHELLEEIALLLDNFAERFMEPDRTIREHRDTLDALRTRDPDVAEKVMHQHLLEFEELAEHFDASRASAKRRTRRAPKNARTSART